MVNAYSHVFLHPAFVSSPGCYSQSCYELYLRHHLRLNGPRWGLTENNLWGGQMLKGSLKRWWLPPQQGAGAATGPSAPPGWGWTLGTGPAGHEH